MKKLTLLTLLVSTLSIPALASIEQGITAFESGNLELAEKILSQESDNSYQKYLYLAKIALKMGNIDDAEDYSDKAIELNSKDAYAQFVYGEIMAKQAETASIFSVMGYIKKVKTAFTAAVNLEPQNTKYHRTLILFHINAPSMVGGDIDEALKLAQNLKKFDDLSGTSALIHVYGHMEHKEKFDEVLKIAMLDFADEPELFYQIGLYYQKQENYSEALTYLHKAATMVTPTDEQRDAKYRAIFQVGRTSILSESNFEDGEKALVQYINEANISSTMPSKNWAKFRLANIAEAKGKKSKAMQIYKDLVQESADMDLQKQVKKRIKKLS